MMQSARGVSLLWERIAPCFPPRSLAAFPGPVNCVLTPLLTRVTSHFANVDPSKRRKASWQISAIVLTLEFDSLDNFEFYFVLYLKTDTMDYYVWQRMSQFLFRYWILNIHLLFVQRIPMVLFRYWILDIHVGFYSECLQCLPCTSILDIGPWQYCFNSCTASSGVLMFVMFSMTTGGR